MSKPKQMFVGIDTSKNSHQVSFLNPTELQQELRIENDREGFRELTDRLRAYRSEGYRIKVACEPTGHYWENLGRHLKEEGFTVKIVNPLHTSRYKEIVDNSPQKDDKKDSRIIARLAKEGGTLHQNLPEGTYAELRELTHLRENLVEHRDRLRNRLHKWLDRHFPEYPKLFSDVLGTTCLGLLEEYKGPEGLREAPLGELTERVRTLSHGKLGAQRAEKVKARAEETVGRTVAPKAARAKINHLVTRLRSLGTKIKRLGAVIKEELTELGGSRYLLSIPGVGWWGAAVFLGEVGDPTRLPRARSAVKIAGLNLYKRQSGKSESGLSITKRGRSLLRKAAYRMALAGVECNREFRDYYEGKLENGTPKVSALVALSAKVLRVMYGVVKNEETYKPLKDRA